MLGTRAMAASPRRRSRPLTGRIASQHGVNMIGWMAHGELMVGQKSFDQRHLGRPAEGNWRRGEDMANFTIITTEVIAGLDPAIHPLWKMTKFDGYAGQ